MMIHQTRIIRFSIESNEKTFNSYFQASELECGPNFYHTYLNDKWFSIIYFPFISKAFGLDKLKWKRTLLILYNLDFGLRQFVSWSETILWPQNNNKKKTTNATILCSSIINHLDERYEMEILTCKSFWFHSIVSKSVKRNQMSFFIHFFFLHFL